MIYVIYVIIVVIQAKGKKEEVKDENVLDAVLNMQAANFVSLDKRR